jgi:micrococcal nuclease
MLRRALILILLLALPPLASAEDFAARVVGISDGDTLTVLRGREQVRIRLHGIDAPEAGQDFGSRAKQHASELAFGKQVTVKPVDTDRCGRTVAEILLPGGQSLNRRMVEDGFAWWYQRFAPGDTVLRDAERLARDARRGLWAAAKPIPPWEWRSGTGAAATVAGMIVANRNSGLYHGANCRNAARIAERNRVSSDTSEHARQAGYRPARDCQER